MTRWGFSSVSSIANGPFRWHIAAGQHDRARLRVHHSVMSMLHGLRLRGSPTASRWVQRAVGDYSESLVAEADRDVRLSFPGFDRYWLCVFFRNDFYEAELYRLFERIRALDAYDFIDGGANIGFWSAVLTSARFGIRRAVAIEASPTTYADLARTAALCGARFQTEHRALSARTGTVSFDQGLNHESRHIVEAGAVAREVVTVEATTIDDLVRRHTLDATHLVVKLDVEGAEFDCFSGGADAFARGAILIYEDHGKDPTSRLTGRLLEAGAACWFIADSGELVAVDSAAAASRFKTNPKRGYNFVCASRAREAEHPLARRLFG